jgi:hypothetical protein
VTVVVVVLVRACGEFVASSASSPECDMNNNNDEDASSFSMAFPSEGKETDVVEVEVDGVTKSVESVSDIIME